MHIDWVVTCRYAESDGAVATIVGAGIDVLHVSAVPAEVAVMVAVRLAVPFEAFEDGGRQELLCRVLGPDSQPVPGEHGGPADPVSLTVAMPPGSRQLVPGWLINPLVAFRMHWQAGAVGSYTLVTSTDEDERLSPVHVLLAG